MFLIPSIIIFTPKNTNYGSRSVCADTRTEATITLISRDIRMGAERPMRQEITHMTTSAATEPISTIHLLLFIARIAPIKNVLSPISMLRIMANVLRKPDSQDC